MSSGLQALRHESAYLDRLVNAAARMGRARQFPGVLAAAVESAEEFLGQVGGMLVLLDASRRVLVVAALENVPGSVMCRNKSLPLAAHLPMTDAVRKGRAIWISGADERARRYPDLAARTPEPYACGSLPLADEAVPLGLLCLIRMGAGSAPRPFDEAERAFAGALADLVAAAVGRLARGRGPAVAEDTTAEETGVYEWDPVRDRLYGNAGMLRLHGRSSPGDGAAGVRAVPGGLPGFSAAARGLGVGGDGQVVSYSCPGRAGQPGLLEARGYLITDRDGGEPRLVGVVTPATPADSNRAGQLARHPASVAILGELSAALAAAVTVDDFRAATATARQVLDADRLVVVEQEADRVHVVASAGAASDVTRPAQDLSPVTRMPPGEQLSRRVPDYFTSADALLARYPHLQNALGELGDHAWAIVPLASGYDAPAACLLAFPSSWSPAGAEQARFLMASGLLAQALDRCRTHDHEHHLASQMQPRPPDALPGLTLASRYRPSTLGLGVGGDFYDAFLHPDGTAALLIGDVQGHGPGAAAMADRLRTAVRARVCARRSRTGRGHRPCEPLPGSPQRRPGQRAVRHLLLRHRLPRDGPGRGLRRRPSPPDNDH
jgi:GAF domain-containing protein